MAAKECVILVMVMVMAFFLVDAVATKDGWNGAHATFYGDVKGNETMQGACGYGDLFERGYGLETTALSTVLFHKGLTCGACYEIQCDNSKWCLNDTIKVTATNICPSNYINPSENWCNPPSKHFDLSQPMFRKIAVYEAGVVPIVYRRTPCIKNGGIEFEIKGNPYSMLILVYNVGGAGDVEGVRIKGSGAKWLGMSRDWGQNWKIDAHLVGQNLSFQVTTSDGRMLQSDNVAPADWKFGHVYEGKQF
ncbi:expansin-A2-like [Cornus florida]|uniref:expansin-A2-like n=1 Tax=Cornus florida TaxID=4283 RepID=UPI0028A08392|nr:expansin-A2-like [Cornus florida]